MATKTKDETEVPMNWGDVLDKLQAGGSSNFIFCKQQRTRLRLVHKPGEPYYTEVTSEFQGRKKTKFMVLAIDMGSEDEEQKVKGAILAKTPFRAIVSLLSEGFNLWDPKDGFGVTVVKTGSGLETQYSVMPSQKVLPIDEELIEAAPTFEQLHEEYRKLSEKRAGGDNGLEEKADGDW